MPTTNIDGWHFYAQNRGDHMEIRARPKGLIFIQKIQESRYIECM